MIDVKIILGKLEFKTSQNLLNFYKQDIKKYQNSAEFILKFCSFTPTLLYPPSPSSLLFHTHFPLVFPNINLDFILKNPYFIHESQLFKPNPTIGQKWVNARNQNVNSHQGGGLNSVASICGRGLERCGYCRVVNRFCKRSLNDRFLFCFELLENEQRLFFKTIVLLKRFAIVFYTIVF